MRSKQFKAESKKLLDMMINSIYTHKEIFLRELISNASDALDKLYFRSLTDSSVELSRSDFEIWLKVDKEARTLTISDNGCGMSEDELENNLGTIAKSGSLNFKKDNETGEDVDIIGQFGVGFYSAFMVSSNVKVISKVFGSDEAFCWESSGASGFTITPCKKDSFGTDIILTLKEDSEEEKYSDYLEQYRLSSLVKKYSDYIRYPVNMMYETSKPVEKAETEDADSNETSEEESPKYETVLEKRTLNSMIPLWKKNKSEITDEEYNEFYKNNFFDYEAPLKVIHSKTEGSATYNALLYIPSHAPFDYFSKNYEKGLKLYSKGVLIADACADLLPDYFNFVRGLVDSEDLSLNISREMLQHDHQLKLIAHTIEKKIKTELKKMLDNERENYEKFYDAFGTQLKFGVYNDYGAHKELLSDLLLFKSSAEKKYVTLAEYAGRMKEDQKALYYACGETIEKIDMLPQVEAVLDKGYELLYLTDYVDEFALKVLMQYEDKPFLNVCAQDAGLDSAEESEALKEENESGKDMFKTMKDAIGDGVDSVRFTHKLKNHPACLSSEGGISAEMEKVLNSMPGNNGVKAKLVLEINAEHPIAEKLKSLSATDEEMLKKYAKLLYSQARLIGGMSIENPAEFSNLICELM